MVKFTKLADIFVNPVSKEEDARRREVILNILLLSVITLLTVSAVSSVLYSPFASPEEELHNAMPIIEIIFVLGLFLALYFISRNGYVRIASYIFIAILVLFVIDLACSWGPDLPTAILFYALIIAISGILIDSRFAFIVTLLLGISIATISYLQEHAILAVDTYWRSGMFGVTDSFIIWVILMIIATVSWLSNREIERSLVRARNSEAQLKVERDLLEVRVKERTDELRKAEMERISQSYRFIEFGRIATGLFHDLMNPLTSISLTIDNLLHVTGSQDPAYTSTLSEDVSHAKRATTHMQDLLKTMRRHLARESVQETFSITRLAEDVLRMLSAYARLRSVELKLDIADEIVTVGNSMAYTQILTNLISNAIESFSESSDDSERAVHVFISQLKSNAHIEISDTGSGMEVEFVETIFEPFVSSKSAEGGLGIGLSLVKQLVENELNGSIIVKSEIGKGTTFTVQFPIREP